VIDLKDLNLINYDLNLINYDHKSIKLAYHIIHLNMSESTLSLNWSWIQLGTTKLDPSQDEPNGSLMQWSPSSATIFFVGKNIEAVEIRLDGEVWDVEVSALNLSMPLF
jgi:hypothetical protein